MTPNFSSKWKYCLPIFRPKLLEKAKVGCLTYLYTHTAPHGIFTSLFTILSLGASACVQLSQFEEAIKWCDKGLAVSFEKYLHEFTMAMASQI